MIPLTPPFRIATASDAAVLADLVDSAGGGLPSHLWRHMAKAGEDPWQIGRTRQAAWAEEGGIVVVDEGAGAFAALSGYRIGPDPIPPEDGKPVFAPLQELENLAPESWYVNVLAVDRAQRGKGYGSRLLGLAEEMARAHGLGRLSIIVADDNDGARRLYERHGYRESAARDVVREDWKTDTKRWILMIRELD